MKYDNTILKNLDNKLIEKFNFISNYNNYINNIYIKYIKALYYLYNQDKIPYNENDLFLEFYSITKQYFENLNNKILHNYYCNYIKFLVAYYLSIKFNLKNFLINIYNNINFNIDIEEVGYHNIYYEYTPIFKFDFNELASEIIDKEFNINIKNTFVNLLSKNTIDNKSFNEITCKYNYLNNINVEFNNILTFINNFKNNK